MTKSDLYKEFDEVYFNLSELCFDKINLFYRKFDDFDPMKFDGLNLVNKVDAKQKQLFVVGDLIKDYNLYLSARNLENAVILQPNEIGVYWLLKQEKVILTKEALAVVEEVLG